MVLELAAIGAKVHVISCKRGVAVRLRTTRGGARLTATMRCAVLLGEVQRFGCKEDPSESLEGGHCHVLEG